MLVIVAHFCEDRLITIQFIDLVCEAIIDDQASGRGVSSHISVL